MKKYLYIMLSGSIAFFSLVQANAQTRFGVKGGLNVATVDYRVYPALKPKMQAAYQIGAAVEFPLPIDSYLGIGLEWQGKGYHYVTNSGDTISRSYSVNPSYLQVPVKWVFRHPETGIMGGVGAYAAYGMLGKAEVKTKELPGGESTTTTEDIRFGSSNDDHFKPFDFGLSIELGYEFSDFRITAEYTRGLGDLRRDPIKDVNFITPANHRVFSFCLTYFFYTMK